MMTNILHISSNSYLKITMTTTKFKNLTNVLKTISLCISEPWDLKVKNLMNRLEDCQ